MVKTPVFLLEFVRLTCVALGAHLGSGGRRVSRGVSRAQFSVGGQG